MRHPNFEDARPLIEDEIEFLIGVLDLLDPDPDLEDHADLEPSADDEPSVGAPEALTGSWEGITQQYDVDCELDDCDDEDEGAYDDSELDADDPDAPGWAGDFLPVYRQVFR